MRFLNNSIPDVILNHVTELLQPFCEEQLTGYDVQKALLQYQRQMFTVAEYAERMQCSRRTVYRAIEAGSLQAVLVGKRNYRIPIQ